MIPLVIYIILTFIVLSVEAVFAPSLSPDVILVLVCFYSLRYGRLQGIVYALICGFILDGIQGILIGPNILSKAIAAYYIRTVRENVIQWSVFIHLIIMTLLSIVNIIILRFSIEYFSGLSSISNSMSIAIKETILTVITSLILYPVFRPDRAESQEKVI